MSSRANGARLKGQLLSGVAFWTLLSAACGGPSTGPRPEDSIPPPGATGSGITNAQGLVQLKLSGVTTQVSVVDSEGTPAVGVRVGAAVGKEVIALVAGDPRGNRPPGFAIYPVAQLSSAPGLAPPAGSAVAPIVILAIKLLPALIGSGLAIWELHRDPLHHKLVVDSGILKSCVAYDIKDVVAIVSTLVSAGGVVVFSSLTHLSTLAFKVDAGGIVLGEALKLFDFADTDKVLNPTCTVLVGNVDFSSLLVVVSGTVGGGILAQDGQVPSVLYVVEPTTGGQDVEFSRIRTPQGAGLHITDMAHWDRERGSLNGAPLTHPELWAVSFNTLYRLNRRSGVAETVGFLGNRGINSLAFNRQGSLYAAGASGELLQIDPNSGVIQRTVLLSPSVIFSGDLVSLPDGRLVGTILGGAGGDVLVEVAPTTGVVATIGSTGYHAVYGLAHFDGTLWALTSGRQLLRLNPTTGQATFVRQLSFGANGGSVGPP